MDYDKEVENFKKELSECSYNVETFVKGVCPFTKFYSNKVVFIGVTGSKTEFFYDNPRAGVYSAEFLKYFGGNEEYALYFNKILLYNRYLAKGQPVAVIDKESGEYYHIDDITGKTYKSIEPVGYFLVRAKELRDLLGTENVVLDEFKMPLSDHINLPSNKEFKYMPGYRDIITNYYINEQRA
jgi:hypothetical protein|uniref:Uncharacterized protein n=1 Tax=Podoviridae sp. ct9A73 TaxID=2825225 RepID=A0A8S5UJQ7_9CAUD|nr:MAG TPA: hypothetical protein [Podoviridae sp. ct9A73]DAS02910.1 MAG TPA: hypothetical protein [Caudoviricetes sp.]